MEFGIQLNGSTQEIITMAQKAEAIGIKNAFVPDHFAMEPPGAGALDPNTPAWEAIAILGAMAQATEKIEIGGLVLCNLFRHPASTAQAMATLDQISGGRAILGLGAGWTKAEFDMTGVPFPDIKPRLRQLDEALTVIHSLWTEERTTFDGEFYHLKDAFLPAKPVAAPPPVVLGGSGKGLLRIAAKHAATVNIIVDTGKAGTVLMTEVAKLAEDGFKKKVDFVREEAAKHGREIQISTTAFIAILTDNEEQTEQMTAAVAGGFGLAPEVARRMPIALVGTADQWVEELQRREAEWGLTHMVLSGGIDAAVLERIGAEVLPRVGGRQAI
ncbi:MAG: LLM class flavin-dependent oxidoreductase [Deltaproteobacteria bacterium]